MSHSSNPSGPKSSLPDDIAAAAGHPREDTSERSLHNVSDRAHSEINATVNGLRATVGDVAEDTQIRSEGYADRAKAVASDARDAVTSKVEGIRARASETLDDARDWTAETQDAGRRRVNEFAERGSQRFDQGKTNVERFVTENPLLVGVVGLAAGLLLGALLPRTRQEDETVGPWADEIKDQGLRYARDFADRGREFVESALDPEAIQAAAQRAGEPSRNAGAASDRPH